MSYWSDVGINEPITVIFKIESDTEQAKQDVSSFISTVKEMTPAAMESSRSWKDVGKSIHEQTYAVQMAISPVRSLSWDMMLMGRGLSVLNHYLLGSNKQMEELIGIVYTVGAVLRIATAAVDIYRVAVSASAVLNHLMAASEGEVATAIGVRTAATVAALIPTAALAALTGGASIAAGGSFAGAASIAALIPSFQRGGTVPQTGPYILHAGETVIPRGGDNFSAVTINMQVGSLASSMDVDRMLDAMALRMAQESRRRLGV